MNDSPELTPATRTLVRRLLLHSVWLTRIEHGSYHRHGHTSWRHCAVATCQATAALLREQGVAL